MLKKIISACLLGLLLVGFWQWSAIRDWWVLNHYQPSSAIVTLADQAGLSAYGRKLFYLGQPQLDSKPVFNQDCPNGELRDSLVLGWYTHSDIFVLQIEKT